jgi:hypothetical protein
MGPTRVVPREDKASVPMGWKLFKFYCPIGLSSCIGRDVFHKVVKGRWPGVFLGIGGKQSFLPGIL